MFLSQFQKSKDDETKKLALQKLLQLIMESKQAFWDLSRSSATQNGEERERTLALKSNLEKQIKKFELLLPNN